LPALLGHFGNNGLTQHAAAEGDDYVTQQRRGQALRKEIITG
jgi:hypothetical protein